MQREEKFFELYKGKKKKAVHWVFFALFFAISGHKEEGFRLLKEKGKMTQNRNGFQLVFWRKGEKENSEEEDEVFVYNKKRKEHRSMMLLLQNREKIVTKKSKISSINAVGN